MSSTITSPMPSPRRREAPRHAAERSHPSKSHPADPAEEREHKQHRHKKAHSRTRARKIIKSVENSMHYSVAAVLIGIAIVMLVETIWALVTTRLQFSVAASSAVAGVLFVLILVEITRTVIDPPDDKGTAIRRLLMIAIVSALREVLLVSAKAMDMPGASGGSAGSSSVAIGASPVTLAASTAVVVGLAFAFALMRRAGGEKKS
jgi:uncharacterized membrane protein (DUF373 family)